MPRSFLQFPTEAGVSDAKSNVSLLPQTCFMHQLEVLFLLFTAVLMLSSYKITEKESEMVTPSAMYAIQKTVSTLISILNFQKRVIQAGKGL